MTFTIYRTRLASRMATLAAAVILPMLAYAAVAATCPGTLGPSETPTADFTVHGDGTVTHTPTGLMWKQCNEGLSGTSCATGTASYMTWDAALAAARNSNFAGYTDWRLPNKQELDSVVDRSCHSPLINDQVFPGTIEDWTWTSTTVAAYPAYAWVVDFRRILSADAVNKSGGIGAVRLVRGGQSFDALVAVADTTPPDTTITSGPVTGTAANALIQFTGTDNIAVTGFECSLDGAAFAACTSPALYLTLSFGSHTFQVRAKDAAGNVDPTPASVTWTVLATQTITVAPPPSSVSAGTPVALTGSSSAGLPVIYTSATPTVCTVSGNTVTTLAAGTCTINANQAGNGTYAAAPQVAVSFTVAAAPAVAATPVPALGSLLLGLLTLLLATVAGLRCR